MTSPLPVAAKAVLLATEEIAPEVRHFRFELPDVERFDFVPGQFVSLSDELNSREITRAYSICSPPSGNRFELCLNRVKEGRFSPYLFALRPGDSLFMQGPFGFFTLRDPSRDMIMVATGTGIAPFRAILASYLAGGGAASCTLIFGVRHENRILYREEFEELERRHANLRFRPTLTRPGPEWRGRTGRVQAHLLEAVGERRDLHVYVCGLNEMVSDVRRILKQLGFDRKQVIYERYD